MIKGKRFIFFVALKIKYFSLFEQKNEKKLLDLISYYCRQGKVRDFFIFQEKLPKSTEL